VGGKENSQIVEVNFLVVDATMVIMPYWVDQLL